MLRNIILYSVARALGPCRLFSISSTCFQLPSHALYPLIDWARVGMGEYAVVDPNDPHAILYLDSTDYIIQTRVSMTSKKKLVVLATPSDSPSSSSSSEIKNSPPLYGVPEADSEFVERNYRRWFQNPFRHFSKVKVLDSNMKTKSLVLISEGNLWGVVGLWALHLHVRLMGLSSQNITRHNVYMFVKTLKRILTSHGVNYLINVLKVNLFVVSAYIGGQRLTTTWPLGLGIKLTHGLPQMLPINVRRAIRARRWNQIRLWMSLFYMYKAIWGTHRVPKFENIAAEKFDEEKNSSFLQSFREYVQWQLLPYLEFTKSIDVVPKLWVKKPFLSNSAGPNFSRSLLGAPLDTLAWTFKYGLYTGQPAHNELVAYLEVIGDKLTLHRFKALSHWMNNLIWMLRGFNANTLGRLPGPQSDENYLASLYNGLEDIMWPSVVNRMEGVKIPSAKDMLFWSKMWDRTQQALRVCIKRFQKTWSVSFLDELWNTFNKKVEEFASDKGHKLNLGKLSLILEAAGKVRVIAIFDWWSQTALLPLHEWIFEVLKKGFGETDATFDQEEAVRNFAKQGYKDLYSFDLKAATDLIPNQLYVIIFSCLLSKEIAQAWLALMTKREFLLPFWSFKDKKGKTVMRRLNHNKTHRVRYTRGQPMGALSSWGALALVHHALVRYSAFRCGHTLYLKYLVLGDDVVIEGKDIALEYQKVCKELGITLSLQKSFISENGLFNFASQTLIDDINISPISLRKELAMEDGFDRLGSLISAIPRNYIDLAKASWLQVITRFVLPRSVYSEVEEARLNGNIHPVMNVIGALLSVTILNGEKTLLGKFFAEKDFVDVIRVLVNPLISFFSLSLEDIRNKYDPSKKDRILTFDLLNRLLLFITKLYKKEQASFVDDAKSFFFVPGMSPKQRPDGTRPDRKYAWDHLGNILDQATVNFTRFVEITLAWVDRKMQTIPTESPPGAKKEKELQGLILTVLALPFIAVFEFYLKTRMVELYDKARASPEKSGPSDPSDVWNVVKKRRRFELFAEAMSGGKQKAEVDPLKVFGKPLSRGITGNLSSKISEINQLTEKMDDFKAVPKIIMNLGTETDPRRFSDMCLRFVGLGESSRATIDKALRDGYIHNDDMLMSSRRHKSSGS